MAEVVASDCAQSQGLKILINKPLGNERADLHHMEKCARESDLS
jgi:hypothetical protein